MLEGHKFQPDMCGYDTGDPWLNDAHSAEELQAGSPVVLIGSRQTGTYVAPVAGTQNLHNIRHNGSTLVLEVSRDSFLPLPTEPPAVAIEAATRNSGGDLIGLNGEHLAPLVQPKKSRSGDQKNNKLIKIKK